VLKEAKRRTKEANPRKARSCEATFRCPCQRNAPFGKTEEQSPKMGSFQIRVGRGEKKDERGEFEESSVS